MRTRKQSFFWRDASLLMLTLLAMHMAHIALMLIGILPTIGLYAPNPAFRMPMAILAWSMLNLACMGKSFQQSYTPDSPPPRWLLRSYGIAALLFAVSIVLLAVHNF